MGGAGATSAPAPRISGVAEASRSESIGGGSLEPATAARLRMGVLRLPSRTAGCRDCCADCVVLSDGLGTGLALVAGAEPREVAEGDSARLSSVTDALSATAVGESVGAKLGDASEGGCWGGSTGTLGVATAACSAGCTAGWR